MDHRIRRQRTILSLQTTWRRFLRTSGMGPDSASDGGYCENFEENGCDSKAIITAMEASDVAELQLNLGQRGMLLHAIEQTSVAASHQQPLAQPADPRASSNPDADNASQPPAQYTRFTDAGAPSGLSQTSREVMTTGQGVVCFWT